MYNKKITPFFPDTTARFSNLILFIYFLKNISLGFFHINLLIN